MKNVILVFAATFLATAPAFAQSTTTANSGSQSVGAASIIQNSNAASGVNYSGGYTVRNTPDLPALYATPTAPCIVSGGMGVSAPGVGVALTGGIRDNVCTWEGKVSMAYHTNQAPVALVMWCINDADYRRAREILGEPCPVGSYPKGQQRDAERAQAALPKVAAALPPAPVQPQPTVIVLSSDPHATSEELNSEVLQAVSKH
jgi:hypothetical protein